MILLLGMSSMIYTQNDKGKKRRSARKSASSHPTDEVKKTIIPPEPPVVENKKVTLKIPLAHGGRGVPDDVELELVYCDDGSPYGDLVKDGSFLRTSKVVNHPSPDESYKIHIKGNTHYTIKNDVTLRGGRFSTGEEGEVSYRKIDLNIYAQINFSPEFMHGKESLAMYKAPLLKQLKAQGTRKVLDESGAVIEGAQVIYKEDTQEMQVTLPAGWSLKKNPARLIVTWPMINPIEVNIVADGVENKTWQLTPALRELHLTPLLGNLPRFDKVEFIPHFKVNDAGLAELYRRLQYQDRKKLTLSYADLLKKKPLLVSLDSGDLLVSGGVIQDEGIKLLGAVESGQLARNTPRFPSGFYHGVVSVPYRQTGSTEIKTVPGLASFNLDDLAIRADGSQFAYFNLVIEIQNNWQRYVGKLKVTGWEKSTQRWRLSVPTGQEGSDLNLILEIKESGAGQMLPVYYAEVLGKKNQNTVRGEDAEKRGLGIQLQESTLLAKITMNLMWEKSVADYLQGVNVKFDSYERDFKELCASYVLPPGYPALTPETLKMLTKRDK